MTLPLSFIKEQKKKLEQERDQLKKQLDAVSKRGKGKKPRGLDAKFPSYGDKEDENAAEVAQYSDDLSLEETLDHALADAEGALKRIENSTYGVCRHCGEAIDQRRLNARPSSSSCVKCKQRLKSGGEKK
ncbi:hypothetical protein A3I42_03685 [Candidatus Uhrbacteria bacterium RIFCSPLOWO2_02_FULL_49_11]|uniref:Zinc finger DksA/TraR C4-type domain-containing protein n=1 Tax=Candidatus Uhrbacteria bacterium RIFCSPLOWO2_02_FULL_49_11 TaxID=1802409 RepID=A0A1F7VAW9_9BACT|nr:MAG: hypothetical protein A3I42_03685 [Candidatus Uhrbacteria bacterium RIFCSPLOWO2_02_FULL_49_11]